MIPWLSSRPAYPDQLDAPTSTQLLHAMHCWHAVPLLLDGLLEVIRLGEDAQVEQSWWGRDAGVASVVRGGCCCVTGPVVVNDLPLAADVPLQHLAHEVRGSLVFGCREVHEIAPELVRHADVAQLHGLWHGCGRYTDVPLLVLSHDTNSTLTRYTKRYTLRYRHGRPDRPVAALRGNR